MVTSLRMTMMMMMMIVERRGVVSLTLQTAKMQRQCAKVMDMMQKRATRSGAATSMVWCLHYSIPVAYLSSLI
jgi:hypothetical protein